MRKQIFTSLLALLLIIQCIDCTEESIIRQKLNRFLQRMDEPGMFPMPGQPGGVGGPIGVFGPIIPGPVWGPMGPPPNPPPDRPLPPIPVQPPQVQLK